MKFGAPLAAALFTSPVGPAVGAIYDTATRFSSAYRWELENNDWIRHLGHQAVDPTRSEFFWNEMFPAGLVILLFGTIIAVFVNMIVGVPVVLLSDRLFRWSAVLQVVVPVLLGAIVGGYLWSEAMGPNLSFDFTKDAAGLVIGGSAALAMTLAARRVSRDWDEIGA